MQNNSKSGRSKSGELKSEELNYIYTQNRELSWLRFNQRVLEEAEDRYVPPMERLKFVSIFSSNLDEFFMVRVGSLFDLSRIHADEIDNKTGLTPDEQLCKIYNVIPGLIKQKKQIYESVMTDLKTSGIEDLCFDELKEKEKRFVESYFAANILPFISPIIVGPHHPAPRLTTKALCICALLEDKKGRKSIGLIPIPDTLAPYVRLPESNIRYIRTEKIILHWVSSLFGSYKVSESCVTAITRNADISYDVEKFEDTQDDFRLIMEKLLKKRKYQSVVRMELDRHPSDALLTRLMEMMHVKPYQVYYDSCPLNMGYVFKLASELTPEQSFSLLYPNYVGRWPEDISQNHSMIEQVLKKDKLLFYPFDSVEPFLKLLNEAAEHPDVVSIKITIYRLASLSKIVRTLCRAAENGKEVIVLMELRARFDESNNLEWSKILEEAGCQVIYGVEDYKCHSKICLITMRSKGKMKYITQIGTGNYKEKTNTMYTDLSLMTASNAIGEDGTAFFRNMLINNLAGEYKELLVAPFGIKSTLCDLIDREISKGSDGYICIKSNSVTERDIIDNLAEASQAGVEVQLIIRGICCILPGVPEYTENVHVTSIVGRFLEHARIYCFGKGGDEALYISSADIMTRNLNRRVEIACPIHDPDIKDQLKWILSCQLRDECKASFMMADGVYCRKHKSRELDFCSQDQFMKTSSHTEMEYIPEKHGFFSRILDKFRSNR